MKASTLRLALNLYPPFLGTGIKVNTISEDFRNIEVTMPLRWYNRNIRGTHFGGNLCSMTDPFFMVMLINVLGKDYDVWDQSSTIRFCKPGVGRMHAHFKLSQITINELIEQADGAAKITPEFCIDITDEQGQVVAQLIKTIYIRKRSANAKKQNADHDIAA